ncbi:MAG TPA: response regulator transcription factor [Ancylobacter sp.]
MLESANARDGEPKPVRPKAATPADDASHLLIVDDDRRIRDLLQRFLSEHGYRVTTAESAADARSRLGGLSFDLLILDVMMPGESGLELAHFVRSGSTVPILMLTARSEPNDRIQGLEIGADDYLAKPFEPRELLLRIGNIIKRSAVPSPQVIETVRFGPFMFHLERGELTREGEPVRLTDRERDMLRVLGERPGDTVPRMALVAPGVSAGDRAVDVQVNRLRRKIERDPANPNYVQTVRGVGYRLVVAP